MLPVYHAFQFQRVIQKGGRTKPWVIIVNEGQQLTPYVVKMFTNSLIRDRDSVTNEVLGNILAKEFDLPVPQAALIEMDDDFYRTIDDELAIEMYDFADERVKFGTRLISPSIEYQPRTYTASELKSMIDIETVFAFDSLIKNTDRTNHNPNMQTNANSFYLLDHDLGFQIGPNTANEQINLQSLENVNRSHIFYEYLSASWAKTKEQFFYTFEEYLRFLNVNKLDHAFRQLGSFGYSCERHQLLRDYFKILKANSYKFANLMRHRISF